MQQKTQQYQNKGDAYASHPLFISFEGCDGSGKSTQSKMLYEYLLSQNIEVVHTREIGGTDLAEKIRDLVVYEDFESMSQLMMVMAARYEHINKVILPALLQGKWVICDRFIDSTACYQSGDSGLDMDEIYELHAKLMKVSYSNEVMDHNHPEINIHDYDKKGIMPDITFFIDIPPKISLQRAQIRQGEKNNFDLKPLAFYQQVYDRFKMLCNKFQERIVVIEGVRQELETKGLFISESVDPKTDSDLNLQKSPAEIHHIILSKLFV